MPISSYPRVTTNNASLPNNVPSGTGISVYDYGIDGYRVLDSNTVPVNEGGFASNNNLISTLGPKLPDLLVANQNDLSAADLLYQIGESLRAVDYSGDTVGNILYQIYLELSSLSYKLQNGDCAIQIKGSNGNLAHVSAGNRLNVVV